MVRTARGSSAPSWFSTKWPTAYRRAVEEADKTDLFGRVEDAEASMLLRREELVHLPNHSQEKRALKNALNHVGRLRAKRIGFPDLASWPLESGEPRCGIRQRRLPPRV